MGSRFPADFNELSDENERATRGQMGVCASACPLFSKSAPRIAERAIPGPGPGRFGPLCTIPRRNRWCLSGIEMLRCWRCRTVSAARGVVAARRSWTSVHCGEELLSTARSPDRRGSGAMRSATPRQRGQFMNDEKEPIADEQLDKVAGGAGREARSPQITQADPLAVTPPDPF